MIINLYSIENSYSRKLNRNCHDFYETFARNVANGNYSMDIQVSDGQDIANHFQDILYALVEGNPELFFINQRFVPEFTSNNVHVDIALAYPLNTLQEKWDELNAEIDRISEIIKLLPTDEERLNRLNQYLSRRIDGSTSMEPEFGNAYGALINKHARCEGFAKSACLILRKLGYKAEVVCGEATYGGRVENHAWNVVEINGKNYYFDFTWNSRLSLDKKIPVPLFMFFDRKTILIDHKPILEYPHDDDDSLIFYNKYKCNYPDLSHIGNPPQIKYNNSYFIMFRLEEKLTQYQSDNDLYYIFENFVRHDVSYEVACRYFESLHVFIGYLIND